MSLDLSSLKKEASRLTEGAGFGKNFVKMPQGKGVLVVRFLSVPEQPFFMRTRTHSVNGRSLHCPRELQDDGFWRGPCPICEYYSLLWKNSKSKSPEEAKKMQEQARAIRPVERYYYNVIVRKEVDSETGETRENVGPLILSVGKTLHEMIITEITGDEATETEGLGDVTDIVNGRDYKIVKGIKKSPDGEFPEYPKSKFMEPSPLGTPEQIEEWHKNVHNLSDLRKLLNYDELLKQMRIHFGLEKDESVGFDPTEFQKGSATTTQGVDVSSDADEDEDEAPTKESKETADVNSLDVDESLVDDDFIKDLEGI
jgi:hypothetical protein